MLKINLVVVNIAKFCSDLFAKLDHRVVAGRYYLIHHRFSYKALCKFAFSLALLHGTG